jgi:23S rRNA (adenine2503-C2)-methyltransferase
MKTMPKNFLCALAGVELRARLAALDVPPYRAVQIQDWLFRRWIAAPEGMANLPRDLRGLLAREFRSGEVVAAAVDGSGDGARKLLLRLGDGETIESVLIPSRDRLAFCLSSQVGCPVRCRFCASGRRGLVRNLDAGEILEQLLACCREAGRRPDNLVFMGIGEPLMNYRELVAALERIGATDGFAFSPRRITISTSGWTSGILQLAREGRPWHLALSLHAPDDELRAQLIPEKCRRPLDEVLAACCEYRERTGRIVTFEYLLLADVNDRIEHAVALARIARECRAKVNLIPYNEVPGLPFARPPRDKVRLFAAMVSERGAPVTIRREVGTEIGAACGQLRATAAAAATPRDPVTTTAIQQPSPAPSGRERKPWKNTSPPSSRPSARIRGAKASSTRRNGSGRA